MRTTITLDDDLMEKGAEYTGLPDRPAIIRGPLRGLISGEAARRLAAMGGSDPGAMAGRRRRPEPVD